MTDRARRGSRALPVYTAAGVTFAAAVAGVGLQMARGEDPALGHGATAAVGTHAAPPPVRHRVLVRLVEKTVVVTRVVTTPAAAVTPSPVPGGSAPARVSAPVSAPAAAPVAAAAPAPRPAPAPAPAPVVTRSS